MRKLNILRTLIDLSFFFLIIGIIGMAIFVPMYLLSPEDSIPIRINGQELTSTDLPAKIVIGFTTIGTLFFVYSIYLLRKTIGFFQKRDIFNTQIIHYFNTIGKCLIICALLTNIPLFFYNMIHKDHLGFEFIGGGFNTLLLSTCLGLFFMVLSEIFKIAISIKQENELTV